MKDWLRYFESNANRRDDLPWECDVVLTEDERITIATSIAIFQLGESSEGRNLLRFAEEWGARHDEPLLLPVTRYFIREEQRHAALLGRFMRSQEIALIRKNWTDRVFRRLRKRAGYELSIHVLVVAEILALVYYPALRTATSSPVLRAICERIVREEQAHVRYQVERIGAAQALRSRWAAALVRHAHRALYAGTLLAVYPEHRRVLRRAGMSFGSFWSRAWEAMDDAFATEGTGIRAPGVSCETRSATAASAEESYERGMGAMSSVKGPASSSYTR